MGTQIKHTDYYRVAKNSLLLYLRMFVTMIISLYTSRVILQTLGFDDYGLYNVVGGFVSLLSFLNGYISQATVRFITFQLGTGRNNRLKEVFAGSLTLHVMLAVAVWIAGETIGVWYVENRLNIVPDRVDVALYVFHLSLVTAALGIIQTPYSATITAHEDMGVYAYISIFDVVMKLLIVYLLLTFDADKLKLYATFYFVVSLLVMSIYVLHCRFKYEECRFTLRIDKPLYWEMFNYIGWSAIGAVAFTLNGQGITVLLNNFFGTVVNAARGVAGSISNLLSQFVFSFQSAMRPQIIKNYSCGNIDEMSRMIKYSSLYSAYMVVLIGIPLFIETSTILRLWLGQYPPYTVEFARLTMIQIIIQAIDLPIGTGINAVGKMKLPNLTSALVYMLILPVSYLIMRLGANPTATYIVVNVCYPVAFGFDIWILNKYIGFPVTNFLKDVCLKVIVITVTVSIIPLLLHYYIENVTIRLVTVFFFSIVLSLIIIYYKGIDSFTRQLIINKVKQTFPFLSKKHV